MTEVVSPVAIVLRSTADTIAVGDPVPIDIEVRNVSSSPIWMIGVLAGAESGTRYPRWTPLVHRADGIVQAAEQPDFTSPLQAADFCRLAPGASFDPTSGVDGAAYFPLSAFAAVSQTPGRYSIALELDTRSEHDAAWQGTLPDWRATAADEAAIVRERLAGVPRVRVRSNTVVVTVVP